MTIRTRNIYDPSDDKPYKLSRSKVDNFISCKRCFYIDRRLGVSEPPGFPFNINSAVDELLKKEFDLYRKKGEPHPYMLETGKNLIPFQHELLDEWRENFKGDDLWFDLDTEEIIVVDYKSTSKNSEVTIDEEWQDGYRRQMDFYQWLMRKNGFKVSNSGYFVYCNGDKSKRKFSNKISFKVSILEYVGNDNWVEDTILDIKKTLKKDTIPEKSGDCKMCLFLGSYNKVVE